MLSVTTEAELGDEGAPEPAGRPGHLERLPIAVAAIAAVFVVAFVAYAITSASRTRSSSSPAKLTVLRSGTVAPTFRLPRLGGGGPVDLASFRGKPTIVNFFASWCTDCRAELGAFGAVSSADAAKVNFVGVDTNDYDPTLARKLLAAAGAKYPVGIDAHGTVASGSYSIAYLPVTYFIDAGGRIVGESFGAQSRASLRHWVAMLER